MDVANLVSGIQSFGDELFNFIRKIAHGDNFAIHSKKSATSPFVSDNLIVR